MHGIRNLSRSLMGLTIAIAAAVSLSWQAKAQSLNALGLEGHRHTVWAVAFSPDGETLASASDDRTVKLWNVKTGTLKQTLAHEGKVLALAFSRDGKMVVSGGGENIDRDNHYGDVCLWDAESGALLQKLRVGGIVPSVVFSPDGQMVAFVLGDRLVRLWNVPEWKLQRLIRAPAPGLRAVAFSPDGEWLATGAKWNSLRLWNVSTGAAARPPLEVAPDSHVFSIQFCPDGKTLAAAVTDVDIRKGRGRHGAKLWDVASGKVLHSLMEFSNVVYSVAFSPDGRLLATASGYPNRSGEVRVWEVQSGRLRQRLLGEDLETAVAFSPDGETLASGGRDQAVKLWDLKQMRNEEGERQVSSGIRKEQEE